MSAKRSLTYRGQSAANPRKVIISGSFCHVQFPDLSALQAFVPAKCLHGRKRGDTCTLCESFFFFHAAPPIRGISIVYCIRDHTAGVQNVWVQYVTFVDLLFWHLTMTLHPTFFFSSCFAEHFHINFVAEFLPTMIILTSSIKKSKLNFIHFFSYQGEIQFINSP